MCLGCLKLRLDTNDSYDKDIAENLSRIICERCCSFHNFLKEVNNDLEVLCLFKMTKYEGNASFYELKNLKEFKGMVKQEIIHCYEQSDSAEDGITDLFESVKRFCEGTCRYSGI
jgi:hypothetical protein